MFPSKSEPTTTKGFFVYSATIPWPKKNTTPNFSEPGARSEEQVCRHQHRSVSGASKTMKSRNVVESQVFKLFIVVKCRCSSFGCSASAPGAKNTGPEKMHVCTSGEPFSKLDPRRPSSSSPPFLLCVRLTPITLLAWIAFRFSLNKYQQMLLWDFFK